MSHKLYNDLRDLQDKITLYFSECDVSRRPYTVAGLAHALGVSRGTLLKYQRKDGYDQFHEAIEGAKQKIEAYVEEQLFLGKPSGPIFNLKNNFKGWMDKSVSEISGPDGGAIDVKYGESENLKELRTLGDQLLKEIAMKKKR